MTPTLEHTKIKEMLPHRHENLLLDTCTILNDTTSTFSLHIPTSDHLNRHIFLKKTTPAILPCPVLAEVAALASIVSSGTIKPGTFAYFAAIINFKLTGPPFHSKNNISGTTEKISSKSGFFKYRIELNSNKSHITGQLMAYYDQKNTPQTQPEPETVLLPPHIQQALTTASTPTSPSHLKSESMTFIDSYIPLHSKTEALYSYTYPPTHPLVKGHFPNNPIMMGVCQWLLLEDAITHLISNNPDIYPIQNKTQIVCNATLFKQNLIPVCTIKQACLDISNETDTGIDTNTTSVKKILFKQRVVPNDTLFIYITDITLS
jgi:3-hydroxymyristoyl/3-hydroxydecanoyl-(acyl carrier protein) dehydratase